MVLAGLHGFVALTTDVNRVSGSQAEREEVVAAIRIALNRVIVPQVANRRTITDFTLECLIGFGSFGHIWKVF